MRSLSPLAIAALLLLPTSALASSTSPGKNSVYVTTTAPINGGGNFPEVDAQILKGKSKEVLEMHLDVSLDGNSQVTAVFGGLQVNGIQVQPGVLFEQCRTTSTDPCTVSGVFWLDLDAAEVLAPGTILGKPLNIAVTGGNWSIAGAGTSSTVTLAAKLVRK